MAREWGSPIGRVRGALRSRAGVILVSTALVASSLGTVLYATAMLASPYASAGTTGCGTWWFDNDSDGFGSGAPQNTCPAPPNSASNNADCNDNNPSISPGDPEVCDANNIDEDCDVQPDDFDPQGAAGKQTYFRDSDQDGFGSQSSNQFCDVPSTHVANSSDCNDTNANISPGDPEVCDPSNTDEDCDSLADNADPNATGKTSFYADADGDGYGAGSASQSCDPTGGAETNDDDCDDTDADTNPDATEICFDGVDNDCSGVEDDAAACALPDLVPGDSPDLKLRCVTRNGRKTCKVKGLEVANDGDAPVSSDSGFVVTLYRSAADEAENKVWGKKTVNDAMTSGETLTLTVSVKKGRKPAAPTVVVDTTSVVTESNELNNNAPLAFA